jgi:hypothetical protein
MYREFLRSRRPRHPSIYLPKEYFLFDGEGGSLPMITDELYQVIEMKVQLEKIQSPLIPLMVLILAATIRPRPFSSRAASDSSLALRVPMSTEPVSNRNNFTC